MIKEKSVLTKTEEEELFQEIEGGEKIEKEVSLSWDGKNLMLRLPKEICHFLDLTSKNRFKKNFRFIIEEKDGKIEKSFELVERTRPKRKENEKKNK